MKLIRILLVLTAVIILQQPSLYAYNLEDRVEEHVLENGIKVLLVERPGSPTVALYLTIKVGASMDRKGETGTAHFLEHLMFKGTKTIGTKDYEAEKPLLKRIEAVGEQLDRQLALEEKGDKILIERLRLELKELQEEHRKFLIKDELSQIYKANGGVGFNAFTSYDITSYHIRFPANKIELWAAAESDRLINPVFREIYSERDVILEERRQRVGTSPKGKLNEQFKASAFTANPYRRPILGWEADMKVLDGEIVSGFFERNYS